MNTSNVQSGSAEWLAEPASQVPARMAFIGEWDTPGRERIELYADAVAGDGCLIAVTPYGDEKAADITGVTGTAEVVWAGRFIGRDQSWRNVQIGITKAQLADWRRDHSGSRDSDQQRVNHIRSS